MRKFATAFAILSALTITTQAQARGHHHRHSHHSAHRSSDIKTVDTDAGPITVASEYADKFVGFINALVADGYKPKEIGCYASHGHMPHSKHYSGRACDIDQDKRNVTAKTMYHVTELAHKFGLEDGCEWSRRPDCGHIEVPGPTHVASHRRTHYVRHRHVHYAHA